CASVDFYRPAAIEQLEIVAKQADISFYRSLQTNPIKAAKEIIAYFKQQHFDHLLLDTAGRLHIDSNLMQELQQIDIDVQPERKLLVLDAMTGQESLKV